MSPLALTQNRRLSSNPSGAALLSVCRPNRAFGCSRRRRRRLTFAIDIIPIIANLLFFVCCLPIVLVVVLPSTCNAQVIKLFNDQDVYFYQLKVDRADEIKVTRRDDFQQTYEYRLGGEGKCAKQNELVRELDLNGMPIEPDKTSNSNNNNNNKNYDKNLDLKSSVLFYPDYEQTLSYAISVSFASLEDQNQIEAYEIVFERNVDDDDDNDDKVTTESSRLSSSPSCVQIMPAVDGSSMKNFKVRFNLTIKDPKLVFDPANIELNRRYLFYFGRVHIRALELCNSNSGSSDYPKSSDGLSLCASATIRSSKLTLGVESNSLNLSKLNAQHNLCSGMFTDKICILSYHQNFNIIISPMNGEMDLQLIDLDVFNESNDDEFGKQCAEAKRAKLRTFNFAGVDLPIDRCDTNVRPHIVIRDNQTSVYDLVFKLVDNPNERISLLSEVYNPTKKNKCYSNRTHECWCPSEKKCKSCFRASKNGGPTIHMNPLVDGTRIHRSNTCSVLFDDHIDLKHIPMMTSFQNQTIEEMNSNMAKKRANKMPIRNFLPTMCFNVRKSAVAVATIGTNDLMRVEILFNDLHRTPQSSLVNSTAYELRVYVLTWQRQQSTGRKTTTTTSVRQPRKDTPKVNAALIGSLIVPSSSLEVVMDNLNEGVYLLELKPIQKSKMCKSENNECIDESSTGKKNALECVRCGKLITILSLNSAMRNELEDKNDEQGIKQDETWSKNPLNYSNVCRHTSSAQEQTIKPSMGVRQAQLSVAKNSHQYKCSSLVADSNKITAQHGEIYAKFVSASFEATKTNYDAALFANDDAYATLYEEFCDNVELRLVQNEPGFNWKLFALIIVIVVVFFILVNVAVVYHQKRLKNISRQIFSSPHTKVVFYVSMFLNPKDQQELSLFVKKFTFFLRKKFFDVDFFVLDFQSERNLDRINDATVIFYVLGTDDELNYHPDSLKLIGSTRFHDELAKMWSQHAKPPKLVRFVLPPSSPSSSSSSKSMWKEAKLFMRKSSGCGNRPQNVADSDAATESLVSGKYLKLPQETHQLVGLIRSGLFDEEHNGETSSSCVSRWRGAGLKRTVREQDLSELEASVKRLLEKSLRNKSNLLAFTCSKYGEQPHVEKELKFE